MINSNNNNINQWKINIPGTVTISYYQEEQAPNAEEQRISQLVDDSYLAEQESHERGYGPCDTCGVSNKKFELELNLRNAVGGHREGSAYNTNQAKSESTAILSGTGCWAGGPLNGGCYRKKNRESLVDKINDAIKEHISNGGKEIIRTLYAG